MIAVSTTTTFIMSDDDIRNIVTSAALCAPRLVADHEPASVGLPLTAMQVDIGVDGLIATMEVAQTFRNTYAQPIEATYIFPLPDRLAVRRFRLRVGDRTIEADIQERGQARANYDDAIAQGKQAAIVEQERSNVFTIRVGNIMPNQAPTVTLSLVGPVSVDDGECTLLMPLVVAPKYVTGTPQPGPQAGLGTAPDTDAVPDASRVTPPIMMPGHPLPVHFATNVRLSAPSALGAIEQLQCSLPITNLEQGVAVTFSVAPGQRLDRDLILRWRLRTPQLATACAFHPDAQGTGGTFAVWLNPPTTSHVNQTPRDIVFVLDRSGSMEGWKMTLARRAIARMIDSLNSHDRFALVVYDNQLESPPSHTTLVPGTDHNRYAAIEYLATIQARGGTETTLALHHACARLADSSRTRAILLVTDGEMAGDDDLIATITPVLGTTAIHTIGIDQAINMSLLTRLATVSRGTSVPVESSQRFDEIMRAVQQRLGYAVLTNIAVQAIGNGMPAQTGGTAVAVTDCNACPDVYAGAPVMLTGRYRGNVGDGATITLAGNHRGEPWQQTVQATPNTLPAWALPTLWAKAAISQLEDEYAYAPTTALENRIVNISVTNKVLSRFTAMVAVDSEVVNANGKPKQIIQAVDSMAPATERRKRSAVPTFAAAPMLMADTGPMRYEGQAGLPPSMARARPASPPAPKKQVVAATVPQGPAAYESAADQAMSLESEVANARAKTKLDGDAATPRSVTSILAEIRVWLGRCSGVPAVTPTYAELVALIDELAAFQQAQTKAALPLLAKLRVTCTQSVGMAIDALIDLEAYFAKTKPSKLAFWKR